MADRSRRSRGRPEEGTPEYDWLYGSRGASRKDDRTRMVPAQPRTTDDDRPDQTRVMPTQPRVDATTTGSRDSAGSTASGRKMTPATPPPPHPATAQSRRRRPPILKILAMLLLLWLVFLIAVPLISWGKIDKVNAEPDGQRPGDQPGTNYLIVGSDKADDLSDEQRKALQTGERGGTNTDTIIVLHTGSGGRTMMSIPRDTLAEIPGHGTGMINSAFAIGKAPLLVATVEDLTGIRIDHYVELGFGSVINTVDALGGVEVCPKIDMKDPLAHLDIKKGCQEVDGLTALGYSRSRHVTALSDLDRVARQREVIGALGNKAVSPLTFINPLRYLRLNNAAAKAIRVDKDMNPVDLGRFALAMTGENKTCTMPNLPAPSDPNRIAVDPERAPALFTAIIKDEEIPGKACTPTGRARS